MRERVLRQLAAIREKHEREVRRLIARAARIGVRSQDIAAALGISRATLWRRYRSDLTYGSDHESQLRGDHPRSDDRPRAGDHPRTDDRPRTGDRSRSYGRAAART